MCSVPSSFVLVYHRSPFDEVIDAQGQRHWQDQKSPNGIIPTLRNLFRSQPSGTWIAWRENESADAEDETLTVDTGNDSSSPPIRLRRIPLRKEQIGSFYHVTSKEAIWPVLHSFPSLFEVNNADWSTFQEVNRRFAEAACNEAAQGASIWIHDYNLWLTPGYIRALRPDVKISLFHHTPFPSSDVFSILPWREEILESLLCCDAVGFHIPRYAENFARAASSLLAVEKGPKTSVAPHFLPCGSALAQPDATPWLGYRGRRGQLGSTPVGTSPEVILGLRNGDTVQQLISEIEDGTKRGRRLILSASRVDYTKGNQELLLAYERLLERRPDLHGEVVLVLAWCGAGLLALRRAAGLGWTSVVAVVGGLVLCRAWLDVLGWRSWLTTAGTCVALVAALAELQDQCAPPRLGNHGLCRHLPLADRRRSGLRNGKLGLAAPRVISRRWR